MSRRVRRLFALHHLLGLVGGLLLLFLSLTGGALIYRAELDRWLHAQLLTDPAPHLPRVSLDQATQAVRKAYPRAHLLAAALPLQGGEVYVFSVKGLPGLDQVMVSPGQGHVLGARDYQASAMNVLRQLHVRFYAFGWQGRVGVGLLGLVLLASTLTGVLIYAPFTRGQRFGHLRRDSGQLWLSDVHKHAGLLSLLFNMVMGLTGLVLGLEVLASRYSPRLTAVLHPLVAASRTVDKPGPQASPLSPSEVLRRAEQLLPGFEASLVMWAEPGKAHWKVLGTFPTHIASALSSAVMLDAQTGAPLFVHQVPQASGWTRAYTWAEPLHFGTLGRNFWKLAYLAFSLLTAALSLSGFTLWLLKALKRRRAHLRFG